LDKNLLKAQLNSVLFVELNEELLDGYSSLFYQTPAIRGEGKRKRKVCKAI